MLALAGDDVLARKSLGRSLPRAQAQAAQVELAPRVRASGLGLTGVRAVAGAACAGEDDNLFAAAVLLAFPTLELIDETTARATAPRRGRCRWRRSAGRRCAPEPAGGEPHGKARGQLSFHTRAVGHIGRADASDGGTRAPPLVTPAGSYVGIGALDRDILRGAPARLRLPRLLQDTTQVKVVRRGGPPGGGAGSPAEIGHTHYALTSSA